MISSVIIGFVGTKHKSSYLPNVVGRGQEWLPTAQNCARNYGPLGSSNGLPGSHSQHYDRPDLSDALPSGS